MPYWTREREFPYHKKAMRLFKHLTSYTSLALIYRSSIEAISYYFIEVMTDTHTVLIISHAHILTQIHLNLLFLFFP